MDKNIKDFKKGIENFRKNLEDISAIATTISAKEIFDAINFFSPSPNGQKATQNHLGEVITSADYSLGQFIASTRIGVGAPDLSISKQAPSIKAEHDKQRAKLKQITGFETIYITNNSKHADNVEYLGWYGQIGTWVKSSEPPYAPFARGFIKGTKEAIKKTQKTLKNTKVTSAYDYLDPWGHEQKMGPASVDETDLSPYVDGEDDFNESISTENYYREQINDLDIMFSSDDEDLGGYGDAF